MTIVLGVLLALAGLGLIAVDAWLAHTISTVTRGAMFWQLFLLWAAGGLLAGAVFIFLRAAGL